MNNPKITEAYTEEETVSPSTVSEEQKIVLEAIKHLKTDTHFKNLCKFLLEKQIVANEIELKTSTDKDTIMRSQGAISVLEYITKLDRVEEFYSNLVNKVASKE